MTIRRRINKKSPIRNYRKRIIAVIAILFLIILIFVIKIIFSEGLWNKKDKLTVVYPTKEGDVKIAIIDPKNEDFISIIIPGNTEVEVAGNFGKWKLKSVWKLGENEDVYGNLLSRTISKHFNFPVFVWASHNFENLINTNVVNSLASLYLPLKSNMKFSDKISVLLFMMRLNNVDKTEINLAKTVLLKNSILSDGQPGYVLSGFSLPLVYSYFHDDGYSQEQTKISIKDGSAKQSQAEVVGKIVEVLGAKVVSIKKEQDLNYICEIKGHDVIKINTLKLIFGCDKTMISDELEYSDVEILLGKDFEKVF